METNPLSPKNENELLSQYTNFAYGIANSYRSSVLPLEDLKQESLHRRSEDRATVHAQPCNTGFRPLVIAVICSDIPYL